MKHDWTSLRKCLSKRFSHIASNNSLGGTFSQYRGIQGKRPCKLTAKHLVLERCSTPELLRKPNFTLEQRNKSSNPRFPAGFPAGFHHSFHPPLGMIGARFSETPIQKCSKTSRQPRQPPQPHFLGFSTQRWQPRMQKWCWKPTEQCSNPKIFRIRIIQWDPMGESL